MLSWTIALSNVFNKKKQNKLPPILDPILLTPGHKLSRQIKEGQLSCEQVCTCIIERARQVQPILNAITDERFEQTLEEARAIDLLLERFRREKSDYENDDDHNKENHNNNNNNNHDTPSSSLSPAELEMLSSPLLGIPITVKESIQVKGMRNTCGLWTRRNEVAQDDAQVVKNVRRLGMIPFCVTNVPESTLYWADCTNKLHGRTVNPYDLSRITGASSGGEGAMLGAGASILGIGSDIGGSLRIPAHYCGVFAHKPSPFLLSGLGNYPAINEARMRMFSLGPMARYASDLRPMLKALLCDGSPVVDSNTNNSNYDNNDSKTNITKPSNKDFEPANISELRQRVLEQLDEPSDLSKLKFFYFKFNESSQLKGKQSIKCQKEFMEAQQEVLDHFSSKFGCQVEQFTQMDKYLKKIMITWQCMLRAGGCKNRDLYYREHELEQTFGIENVILEFLKVPLGLSKHTKESLLAIMVGGVIPEDKEKAYALCEKFEAHAQELRQEVEQTLGSNGCLLMPTLPTTAYKHNEALLRAQDIRFTALFNVLELPCTHATFRLDKKNQLPFGFTLASLPYNDAMTIAIAEEIELSFGGWRQPSSAIKAKGTSSNNQLLQQQQQHQQLESNGLATRAFNTTTTLITDNDCSLTNHHHHQHQNNTDSLCLKSSSLADQLVSDPNNNNPDETIISKQTKHQDQLKQQ